MVNNEEHTILTEQTIILQDVQDSAHLAENQDSRAFLLHRCEKLVEDDHPPGGFDEMNVSRVRRAGFLMDMIRQRINRSDSKETCRSIKEIWVTRHFSQLCVSLDEKTLQDYRQEPTCMTIFINRVFPSFLPVRHTATC